MQKIAAIILALSIGLSQSVYLAIRSLPTGPAIQGSRLTTQPIARPQERISIYK
jgi:hypothetical protein